MTLRQRMQSLACNVFLSDLTLEFDAVGVVLGHGFHPWKARRPRSIPNPRPVYCQGRTPADVIGRLRLFCPRSWSLVADAADSADGIFGKRANADHSRSCSALARECNLKAQDPMI